MTGTFEGMFDDFDSDEIHINKCLALYVNNSIESDDFRFTGLLTLTLVITI